MAIVNTLSTSSYALAAGENLIVTTSGSIISFAVTAAGSGNQVNIAGAVQVDNFLLGGNNLFSVSQGAAVQVNNYIAIGYQLSSYVGQSTFSNAGTISSNGYGAILYGNDNLAVNTGTIAANNNNAILMSNGAGGQIVNEGLLSSRAGATVAITTSGGSVNNSGTIIGKSGYAVQGNANDLHLTNSGTITSNATLSNAAVFWTSFNGSVTNSGEINGITDYGLSYQSSGTISNSGSISGETAAVLLTNYSGNILNTGTITSIFGTGIQIFNTAGTGPVTLRNGGTITAGDTAYQGTVNVDIITNTGTINGNVVLDGGSDIFDNRGGKVDGLITGGAGDDLFFIDSDTSIVENAGEGNDSLFARTNAQLGANIENLTLLGTGHFYGTGNADTNTITGNAGDNRLSGLAGNDTVLGNNGNDTLNGGAGLDSLTGGDGDDLLRGTEGNDTLIGGDGDDTVTGGAGSDVMSGGLGNDTFVFAAFRHSTNLPTTADRITDFTQGEDRIDLSGIDANQINTVDDAFVFIGSAPLSAAGQVSVSIDTAANLTYVRMDIDGDGAADSILRLTGKIALTAGDFIL